jgi:hypothetical protein
MHLTTTLSTVTTSLKPKILLVLSLTVLSLAPKTKTERLLASNMILIEAHSCASRQNKNLTPRD